MTGLPILVIGAGASGAALLVYVVVTGRRAAAPQESWSPPVSMAPVLATPGGTWHVAGALGRAESRHLALSPWFGVGLGFLAIFLLVLGGAYATDNGEVWHQTGAMLPWFAHPLAGMTVLAVHRAVTRPIRDGSDELFESCPTEPIVRVIGILRTAVVPVGAFAVFLLVYGMTVFIRSTSLHGPVTLDTLPLVLAGLVLLAGAVCLGAALGTWVRFGLAPVVAIICVGLLALELATAGDPGWNRYAALSTFGPDGSPLLHALLPTWWYLLWITALVVVVAVVAVARFRRDRPVRLAAVVGLATALVAALFGTSGPGAQEARHVAALIARPAAHQSCASAGALVDVCTYRDYGEMKAKLSAAVAPVAAALPPQAQAVILRQGFHGTDADLPAEVRRRLPAGVPAPDEDEIPIGFAADDSALLEYRLLVAFAALGLPLPADARDEGPLVVGGQARGVVALWLAARGLDLDDATGLATVEEPGDSDENLVGGADHDAFELGLAWPTMCGPVVWAPQDLAAARSLMQLEQSKVAAVIKSGFARWSDPATPTDDLLRAVGVPAGGSPSKIVTRRESYC